MADPRIKSITFFCKVKKTLLQFWLSQCEPNELHLHFWMSQCEAQFLSLSVFAFLFPPRPSSCPQCYSIALQAGASPVCGTWQSRFLFPVICYFFLWFASSQTPRKDGRGLFSVFFCRLAPYLPSPFVFLPAMLKHSVVRPYRYARRHECRRAGNRCGRASRCESRFCPSLRGLAKQSRFPFPRSYEVIRNDMETLLIPGLLRSKTPSQRQTLIFISSLPVPGISSQSDAWHWHASGARGATTVSA